MKTDLVLANLAKIDELTAAIRAELTGQPAPNQSSLPLLTWESFTYRGSARLPRTGDAYSDFQYGATVSCVQRDGTLLMEGRESWVATVALPNLTITREFGELLEIERRSAFEQIDDRRRFIGNPTNTMLRGLLDLGDYLVMSVASYYDAAYAQQTSHLLGDRKTEEILGPFRLAAGAYGPGFLGGRMCEIPDDWREQFGGCLLTGNFGLPIVTRESWGPCAFACDPRHAETATPALAYTQEHPLGPWDGQSDVWNCDSTFAGMAFPACSRSVLFFGVHGIGPFWYGLPDQARDPENGTYGTHSYPYVFRCWAYDAEQLAAVVAGQLQPWEPQPYGVWNLELPLPSTNHHLQSACFDLERDRLYLVQGFSDRDPAQGWPVVHVYEVDI